MCVGYHAFRCDVTGATSVLRWSAAQSTSARGALQFVCVGLPLHTSSVMCKRTFMVLFYLFSLIKK